jgi:hypothetical protein
MPSMPSAFVGLAVGLVPSSKKRSAAVWPLAGIDNHRGTIMGVVTDGYDGLRNFVQRSSPRPMESQLDWFHIGMKLELLR